MGMHLDEVPGYQRVWQGEVCVVRLLVSESTESIMTNLLTVSMTLLAPPVETQSLSWDGD